MEAEGLRGRSLEVAGVVFFYAGWQSQGGLASWLSFPCPLRSNGRKEGHGSSDSGRELRCGILSFLGMPGSVHSSQKPFVGLQGVSSRLS